MFSTGEYVVYETNGVCKIDGTTTLNMSGIPADRLYYVLSPLNMSGTMYVPVDKSNDVMRKIITREDAERLVTGIQEIEPLQITDEKALEQMYRRSMRHFDCTEWVRLIKFIYLRKQRRRKIGNNMTSTDEKYMHMAENSLYSELALALEIPKDEVLNYIFRKNR